MLNEQNGQPLAKGEKTLEWTSWRAWRVIDLVERTHNDASVQVGEVGIARQAEGERWKEKRDETTGLVDRDLVTPNESS